LTVDGFEMSLAEFNQLIEGTAVRRKTLISQWQRNVSKIGAWIILLGMMIYGALARLNPFLIAIMAVSGFILWSAAWGIFTARRVKYVRWQVLAERGLPICISCGYNLTGCTTDLCPECGDRRSINHSVP
jgi:hypothetical protein